MIQLRQAASTISAQASPVRRKGAWAQEGRLWLTGLAIACAWLPAGEAKAANPAAVATWYCPYTQEGDCTPYTRSYGYTPTRWHKWPTTVGKQPPEAISTPTPAKPPAEPSEELPSPNLSLPGKSSEEPAPSDEIDLAPSPPSRGAPAVPPELKDGQPIPQEDLHDLFQDDMPTPSDKPVIEPEESPDSEMKSGDPTEAEPTESGTTDPEESDPSTPPMERRVAGTALVKLRFTSAAGETKMHWRRSKRLAPSDVWPSDAPAESSVAAAVLQPTGRRPVAMKPAMRLTSNPLRDSQGVGSASAPQSQTLAGSDTAAAAGNSTASPAWHSNPLRSGQ